MKKTFTLREAARLAAAADVTSFAGLAAARALFTADGPEDIADPMGQDAEYFRMIGSQIADLLGPALRASRPTSE